MLITPATNAKGMPFRQQSHPFLTRFSKLLIPSAQKVFGFD
jgi:hypothetical protein